MIIKKLEVFMKKIIILLLLTTLCSNVFAKDQSWLTMGLEFSQGYETVDYEGTEITGEVESKGINISAYSFSNDSDLGIFIKGSILEPQEMTVASEGQSVKVDLDIYDTLFSVGITAGPAFKSHITDNTSIFGGAGLHMFILSGNFEEKIGYDTFSYSYRVLNLGIGADLGLKYTINNFIFLSAGCSASYDIESNTEVSYEYGSESETQDEWADDYSYLSFNPFLSIGILF